MSKHTQGEWFAEKDWLDVEGWAVFKSGKGGDYCVAYNLTEANAHLIAAAPKLLEACEDMIEFLNGFRSLPLTTWKAAIAAAKGEQS